MPGTTHPSDPPAHKEPAAPNTNTVADGPTIPDAMLKAVVAVLKDWPWERRPTWICPMPSRRRSSLIQSLAQQVGAIGKLPVHPALKLAPDGPPADDPPTDPTAGRDPGRPAEATQLTSPAFCRFVMTTWSIPAISSRASTLACLCRFITLASGTNRSTTRKFLGEMVALILSNCRASSRR